MQSNDRTPAILIIPNLNFSPDESIGATCPIFLCVPLRVIDFLETLMPNSLITFSLVT